MKTPTMKPRPIARSAATATSATLSRMSALKSPPRRIRNRLSAISDGGITVVTGTRPLRQASSSASTAGPITSRRRLPSRLIQPPWESSRAQMLERFRPQLVPEPAVDLAEMALRYDAAVAIARPPGFDRFDEQAGPCRHDADAVRQHGGLVKGVGDQQH